MASTGPTSRRLTVPNLLTGSRVIGSVVLVGVALTGRVDWFIGLFLVLLLTDGLDGRLAVWLDQATEFGARLDSIADATLSMCLLIGAAILRPDFFATHLVLVIAMLASFFTVQGLSFVRFGRLPALHTWAAKGAWVLVIAAVLVLLASGSPWPARIAMALIIVANLEALLIVLTLPVWRANVRTLWHVRHARAQTPVA